MRGYPQKTDRDRNQTERTHSLQGLRNEKSTNTSTRANDFFTLRRRYTLSSAYFA